MESQFSDGANRPEPWDYPLGSPESRAAARLAFYDPELEAWKAKPGVTRVIRCGPLLVVVERISGRQDEKATKQQPGKETNAG